MVAPPSEWLVGERNDLCRDARRFLERADTAGIENGDDLFDAAQPALAVGERGEIGLVRNGEGGELLQELVAHQRGGVLQDGDDEIEIAGLRQPVERALDVLALDLHRSMPNARRKAARLSAVSCVGSSGTSHGGRSKSLGACWRSPRSAASRYASISSSGLDHSNRRSSRFLLRGPGNQIIAGTFRAVRPL